jgi:hypothetical protein
VQAQRLLDAVVHQVQLSNMLVRQIRALPQFEKKKQKTEAGLSLIKNTYTLSI